MDTKFTNVVYQIVLCRGTKPEDTVKAIVFIDSDKWLSVETGAKLATEKARKNLPGFEDADLVDYTYLGMQCQTVIIK